MSNNSRPIERGKKTGPPGDSSTRPSHSRGTVMLDPEPDDLFEIWWTNQLTKIPAESQTEQFLDTEKAAKLADKKSTSSIRNWIESGKIQAVPNGTTWRVHVPSLKEYLREKWVKNL